MSMTRALPAIRSATVARLVALALTAGALGVASLRPGPAPHSSDPAPLAPPSSSVPDAPWEEAEPSNAEPLTVTDEVLDWASRMIERVRTGLEEPTAESRRIVEESSGLRVLLARSADAPDELRWERPAADASTPRRLVLLVHGLDEPGDIWDDLAPALREAGHAAARFDYPNDQPVAASADLLASALGSLCHSGTERIDIVAHSMGGLVARDVLTRAEYYHGRTDASLKYPAVDRLITIGTPNYGAPLAPLRGMAEIRDQLARLADSEKIGLADLLRFSADGGGEAGIDLAPGSDFLNELNARPLPRPCVMTIIYGRVISPEEVRAISDSRATRAIGLDDALDDLLAGLAPICEDLGDGVVPAASALLDGVDDVVELEGNHRAMLRTVPIEKTLRSALGQTPADTPPAIAVILERLGEHGSTTESPAPED